MGTPAVVEKQTVDIGLGGGIDESQPEASVDWTKRLTVAVNVRPEGNSLVTRPGLYHVYDKAEADPAIDFIRLGDTSSGICGIGFDSKFWQLGNVSQTESRRLKNLGTACPHAVTKKSVLSASVNSAGVKGLCAFSKYDAILTNDNVLAISDSRHRDTVRNTYHFRQEIFGIVGVDDRYIHVIRQGTVALKPGITVIDTENLPVDDSAGFDSSTTLTWTDLANTVVADQVAGIASHDGSTFGASSGGFSVVASTTTAGTVTNVQKFSATGTSLAFIGQAFFNQRCSGIDIGVAGTTKEVLLVGCQAGAYKAQWITSAYAAGATLNDTTSVATTKLPSLRCSCSKTVSGEARIIASTYLTPSGVASDDFRAPIIELFSITSASAVFTYVGTCPGWLESSLPFWNIWDGKHYMHISNYVQDDAGAADAVANCTCIIEIPATQYQKTFHEQSAGSVGNIRYTQIVNPVVVLPTYTQLLIAQTTSNNPNTVTHSRDKATFGSYGIVHTLNFNGAPYRPHANGSVADGATVAFATVEAVDNRHQFGTGNLRPALYSYNINHVSWIDPRHVGFSSDTISGGIVCHYDGGQQPSENGFLTAPSLFLTTPAAGGTIAAGTYGYLCVFKHIDANGRTMFSRVSKPISITIGANQKIDTIQCNYPTVTRITGTVVVELYRTAAGGTQYFLHSRKEMWNTTATYTTIEQYGLFTIGTDNTADANLINGALLHRQPGTQGSALDRYPALCGSCCVQHKDRMFYATGSTVYYSSFNVENESWWFNPAFSFNVHGGTGPITALASMDGVLVVFKADAVFIVDGDGPPENGGNGTEFSPPRRIHTEMGCVDQRTLASTPNGIMYVSARGVELLTRNYQVQYIGERISRTFEDHKFVGGAAFDRILGRYILPLGYVCKKISYASNALGFMNIITPFPGIIARISPAEDRYTDSAVIVYDTVADAWTRNNYDEPNPVDWNAALIVAPVQDFAFSSYDINRTDTLGRGAYCAWASKIRQETIFSNSDWHYHDTGGARVLRPYVATWKLQTGWIRHPTTKQDNIRVSDVQTLGNWLSSHRIRFRFKQNYVGSKEYFPVANVFTIKEFGPTDGFGSSGRSNVPYQRLAAPDKESVQAIQFIVETDYPGSLHVNEANRNLDQQMELVGLSVRLGVRNGGPKMPAAQKG